MARPLRVGWEDRAISKRARREQPMPTEITFANGQTVRVDDDAGQVQGRLNEAGGLPVRLEVQGGAASAVFVNPQQVAYFQDVQPSVYESPDATM
jgi:hypothetical protein